MFEMDINNNAIAPVSFKLNIEDEISKTNSDCKSQIADFFADKSVFITGATGFLGKVLVEKLLRSCAEVKHIYILIRNKKGKDVNSRLQEILDSQMFDKIRECNSIALKKVVAIEGDITLPGLGISETDLLELVENVSAVFHSAATIRFSEPLKTAIDYNVFGTKRVVELCYKLPKLSALIHVSTAYSNSNRLEIDEIVYPSKVPPQQVIDLCETLSGNELEQTTKELLEGHASTYTFTKGMIEKFLDDECQDLPIAIIRPSIIGASWAEPLPGWVDGPQAVTGSMILTGKGILRQAHTIPSNLGDMIPVDTVVNLMIALVWFTATKHPKAVQVYNCTSGSMNPITCGRVVEYMNPPYSTKYPSLNTLRYPIYSNFTTQLGYNISLFIKEKILAYFLDFVLALTGRKKSLVSFIERVHRACEYNWWFCMRDFHFSNKNLLNVYSSLCETDKTVFNFNIRALDWEQYFDNYWLGIRKYCLKERTDTLEEARAKLNKIYYRDKAIMFLIAFMLFLFICALYYNVSTLCPYYYTFD